MKHVFSPNPDFSVCLSDVGLIASHSTQCRTSHVSAVHHHHQWKKVTCFPMGLKGSGFVLKAVFSRKKRGHGKYSVNICIFFQVACSVRPYFNLQAQHMVVLIYNYHEIWSISPESVLQSNSEHFYLLGILLSLRIKKEQHRRTYISWKSIQEFNAEEKFSFYPSGAGKEMQIHMKLLMKFHNF